MTIANRFGPPRGLARAGTDAATAHAVAAERAGRRKGAAWAGRLLTLLPLLPALAGCLNRAPDPTSTTVVYGDHTEVANCFLVSTDALVTQIVNEPGREPTITMTVGPALPNAYRVVFTDLPDDKVGVAGYTIGTTPVAFFWFSFVRPKLRGCAGQLDVR